MDVSAEAADVVVREGLQATEAAAKLTGEAVKNIAALLLALARQDMKVVGKTTAQRLARDTSAPAVVIPIKAKDKNEFEKLAKDFGILYFIAQKRGSNTGILNVVSNQNYAAQLNAVMEQMGYPIPEKAKGDDAAKKANPRAPQEKSSKERGSGLNPPPATEPNIEEPAFPARKGDVEDSPTKKRLAHLNSLARQTNAARDKVKERTR